MRSLNCSQWFISPDLCKLKVGQNFFGSVTCSLFSSPNKCSRIPVPKPLQTCLHAPHPLSNTRFPSFEGKASAYKTREDFGERTCRDFQRAFFLLSKCALRLSDEWIHAQRENLTEQACVSKFRSVRRHHSLLEIRLKWTLSEKYVNVADESPLPPTVLTFNLVLEALSCTKVIQVRPKLCFYHREKKKNPFFYVTDPSHRSLSSTRLGICSSSDRADKRGSERREGKWGIKQGPRSSLSPRLEIDSIRC